MYRDPWITVKIWIFHITSLVPLTVRAVEFVTGEENFTSDLEG